MAFLRRILVFSFATFFISNAYAQAVGDTETLKVSGELIEKDDAVTGKMRENVGSRLNELDHKLRRVAEKLDSLQDKIDRINSRIERLQRMENQLSRIDALDRKIDRVDDLVRRLERSQT